RRAAAAGARSLFRESPLVRVPPEVAHSEPVRPWPAEPARREDRLLLDVERQRGQLLDPDVLPAREELDEVVDDERALEPLGELVDPRVAPAGVVEAGPVVLRGRDLRLGPAVLPALVGQDLVRPVGE